MWTYCVAGMQCKTIITYMLLLCGTESFTNLLALCEGKHWSPVVSLTKASNSELLCYFTDVYLELHIDQTVELLLNWGDMTFT